MAEEKSFPMTADGKAKLEQELEDLRLVRRPEVINRIKIARSYGDLSENSEYESAKDEQAFVAADEVSMGREITFQELPDEEPESYTIVGESESDPLSGKISNESPMAKGLLGHKVGDTVEIEIPNGSMKVKILSVK
ncbi:MAG: transcription elongation factor GreA [Limosilactobacillus fermentum]|nr:transcription elongation factor GreA [Limosilactobacillus fermentum]